MKIADQHVSGLIRDGYTLVERFLTPPEVTAAKQNMLRYVPTPQELAATPERYPWIFEEADRLQTEFPFVGDALNHISTHPDLIDFVERALKTRAVLLSQSAIWAKYARTGDFEQALHLDYQGNTLVAPREDGDYRQVNMILYYTDVTADMGPTCIVPLKQTARRAALANLSSAQQVRGSLQKRDSDHRFCRLAADFFHEHFSSCLGDDRGRRRSSLTSHGLALGGTCVSGLSSMVADGRKAAVAAVHRARHAAPARSARLPITGLGLLECQDGGGCRRAISKDGYDAISKQKPIKGKAKAKIDLFHSRH